MRVPILAALALVLFGGPALATDGPIATANGAGGAPAPETAAPPPVVAPDAADYADAPDVVPGPCGPTTIGPDGKPDTRAHGEVDVGVGTRGYRHVRLSACKPIGREGAIAISVSETQADWGRRR